MKGNPIMAEIETGGISLLAEDWEVYPEASRSRSGAALAAEDLNEKSKTTSKRGMKSTRRVACPPPGRWGHLNEHKPPGEPAQPILPM